MENIFNFILRKEVISPILIVIFSFIIYFIISKIIKDIFNLKIKRINNRKRKTLSTFFINILRYLIIIIAVLMILGVYGINTTSIVASLGVVSVVLGLALQDMVKDFVSGISMVLEDTYNVGDWVTINDFDGEVISLGMKTTRVKGYSGDVLVINNGSITQVINHSISNSLAIVDVTVAYDSDIEKVEKVLNDLCSKLSNELVNLKGKVQLLGIEDLNSSSVIFRITAEVKAETHYQTQREIKKQIKLEFDKNKITIPYHQVVIHNG